MKFGYTILYVENVEATLGFYERAFGFSRKMLHEAGDYGELETGETTLAFAALTLMAELGKSPKAIDPKAPSFEIALITGDVPAALERAQAAGAALVSAPADMPWGQTIAYVSDLNGCLVEICTAVVP
ncbi:MAG: VOC family protein [Rhodobacteraceae bacterium]|nr:VOC family protein [Paracoccaceae bacterium]